jgi:hypothetical protein
MKHIYSLLTIGLLAFGSVTNCSNCDKFIETNKYLRDDDLEVDLCARCQSMLHA